MWANKMFCRLWPKISTRCFDAHEARQNRRFVKEWACLETSCSWIIVAIRWNWYDKLTFNLDHLKGAGQFCTPCKSCFGWVATKWTTTKAATMQLVYYFPCLERWWGIGDHTHHPSTPSSTSKHILSPVSDSFPQIHSQFIRPALPRSFSHILSVLTGLEWWEDWGRLEVRNQLNWPTLKVLFLRIRMDSMLGKLKIRNQMQLPWPLLTPGDCNLNLWGIKTAWDLTFGRWYWGRPPDLGAGWAFTGTWREFQPWPNFFKRR